MPTPSVFDQFRLLSRTAAEYSQGWLEDLTDKTAMEFTDWACFVSGFHPKALPPHLYQASVCNAVIAGRWAMCGYPTVVLGHRTAAAFMATKIRPQDAAEFVRPPWPAFGIRIPPDILEIEFQGQPRQASFIVVTGTPADPRSKDFKEHPGELQWWYKLIASTPDDPNDSKLHPFARSLFAGVSMWGYNLPTSYLAREDSGASEGDFCKWNTMEVLSSDSRADRLARLAIMSACLFLAGDPRELENRPSKLGMSVRSQRSKLRPDDTLPQYTSYEVQSAIKINLHHAMRDYCRHGGSSPSVQTLAAGHWKRVAYGPAHSLRRVQLIEPYWRGPVDAPISVRTK